MTTVTQAVALVAVIATLLGAGIAVVSASYADTPTHVETVDNETIVVDYDNLTAVDAATQTGTVDFLDNESVYDSDGNELVEGTDYEWYTNGTVEFINTTATSEDEAATVTYAYNSRPDQAASMIGPLAVIYDVGGVLPLVAMAGAVFLTLGKLTQLGGGFGGSRR